MLTSTRPRSRASLSIRETFERETPTWRPIWSWFKPCRWYSWAILTSRRVPRSSNRQPLIAPLDARDNISLREYVQDDQRQCRDEDRSRDQRPVGRDPHH